MQMNNWISLEELFVTQGENVLAVVVPAVVNDEVPSSVESEIQPPVIPVNDPYDLTIPQPRFDFSTTVPTASARLTRALREHTGPMDVAGIDALQAIVVDENPALQAALDETVDTPPPSPPVSIPATDAPSE